MEQGTYHSDSPYNSGDEEEEDPRIIEMYDMACSAVGWSTPPTYRLPSTSEVQREQKQDKYMYTSHNVIRQVLQQSRNGETQTHSDGQWAQDNEANYMIPDGVLKKAWVKGKGKAAVTVWQTVVPAKLRANVMQAFHTSGRNLHYGDLKTFTHIREHYILWNAMFKDVRTFVWQCEVCSRFGTRPDKAKRKYHVRNGHPGEHWVVDMVHLPKSK